MLLAFAELKRLDDESLRRISAWCDRLAFPAIHLDDLQAEAASLVATGIRFAQFAPIALRPLSSADRRAFVSDARGMLVANRQASDEEEQVLRHIAFKLGVSA
jgi:uncharacterized tellurite resistance protein B-like protein